MREKGAVMATVQQCLATWGATVKRAAEAGYTFCLVGYFEIPDTEHYMLWPLLAPLLDRIEGQGYQALVFKPHMPSVYDKTASTVLGQLQEPWEPPRGDSGAAGAPREVHLWSTHYIHTRDVTTDDPPAKEDDARGVIYPASELPSFLTSHTGYKATAAVGACWHQPRLR